MDCFPGEGSTKEIEAFNNKEIQKLIDHFSKDIKFQGHDPGKMQASMYKMYTGSNFNVVVNGDAGTFGVTGGFKIIVKVTSDKCGYLLVTFKNDGAKNSLVVSEVEDTKLVGPID